MSVAELMARFQDDHPGQGPGCRQYESAAVPAPRSSASTEAGSTSAAELLRREGRAEEQASPARPSRMHRMGALAAGVILLCGAVTASAAALSGPRIPRSVPSATAPATIAGAEALYPDLINELVMFPPPAAAPREGSAGPEPGDPNPAGDGARPPAPFPENSSQREPGVTAPIPGAPQPLPITAPRPPAELAENPLPSVQDPDQDPDLDLVVSFFETATVAPRKAFSLLDSQMQGAGYEEFRNAWAEIERVSVAEIHRTGPTTALVTVSFERKDGSVLHTLQRVQVVPGSPPRITDARLLSASRS